VVVSTGGNFTELGSESDLKRSVLTAVAFGSGSFHSNGKLAKLTFLSGFVRREAVMVDAVRR
jgi:hypothetical protein